ncbi:MAG: 3'-5' exonuclease [Rikenellaceae bacterium]
MSSNIFDGLNAPQREAVENFTGPTLIIAGAGSGKTRTLTCRIANMIDKGVKPWNILALTFTNKASREMQERIRSTVSGDRLRGIYMGTFHGVFRRLLSENAELLGFPTQYTIYDSSDSQNLIKQIVKDFSLADDLYKPRVIASRISLAKNNLMLPDVYSQRDAILEEDRQMRIPRLHEVYREYFRRCKAAGAMDFDDILLYMNILLRDHPEVTERYGQQFQYILVDEYQDTNSSQYLILKRLAQSHHNICVVGDDSQSIYSFRGAKIENILKFQSDYSEAKVIKLEQNYRSSENIVNAANSLIEHNTRKLPKKLFSAQGKGDKITVKCCYNERNEADEVARSIQNGLYRGATADDFAILYRTNSQSRQLEDSLRHRNIPYRIFGGQSFYQRAEIKDMLAYLKLAINPKDDQAFLRIINFPARGIGATSLARLTATASQSGLSLMETLQSVPPTEMGIRGVATKGLSNFATIFGHIYESIDKLDAYEFAHQVALRSGVLQHLQQSKLIEDQSRLENIEELLNSIKEYVDSASAHEDDASESIEQSADEIVETLEQSPSIGNWLLEVSLLTDQDQGEDDKSRVTLLTVHASKGLEFGQTYIVGLEENLFPSGRCGSDDEIEEERRIFYVALTRARHNVMLSFAQSRFRYGETVDCLPSRFLGEIDTQYLDGDVDLINPRGERSRRIDELAASSESRRVAPSSKYVSSGSPTAASATRTPQPTVSAHRNLRSVARTTAPLRNASPESDRAAVASSGQLKVGVKVEHPRFGRGEVTALEKAGNDMRITVEFQAHGSKTLLERFAKLRIL